jgi:VanZ family protein
LGALSLFKSLGLQLEQIYALEELLGGDKWAHFQLAAVLAVLGCFAFDRVLDLRPYWSAVPVVISLALALAIDETFQYVLASRRFEVLDFACGLAGLTSGCVVYVFCAERLKIFGFSRRKSEAEM